MKFIFNSKTREGIKYTVTEQDDGRLQCNCPASEYYKDEECVHAKRVRVYLTMNPNEKT